MTILAEGTIPSIRAVIFKADPDFHTDVINFEKVDITKITMFNNVLAEQTVVLFVKKQFGTLRKLRQYKLKQNENGEYLEPGEVLPLQAGDILEAQTTTDDAVDFVVYGKLS